MTDFTCILQKAMYDSSGTSVAIVAATVVIVSVTQEVIYESLVPILHGQLY